MSPRASELVTALSLLSRLPLPRGVANPDLNAASAWAYGAVGLGLGLLASLAMLCAMLIGLPAPLVALTGLGTLIALSGAMHEDGLA
ncbi:MAG TPA: adenosylcobinamide-GDP ribazoletransferase, partial [Roseovarius nubinhibens]|nr:adenosylcobinamide-GDP ribazoletransferase [Roseovarius nubinhibens]